MTPTSLRVSVLLAATGAALITLPGAAFAQGLALSRPASPAPTSEPEALEVISLRNPCEEGTPFFHEYGSYVMMQYGYRSCPVPLF
jgi:hypothetical protein